MTSTTSTSGPTRGELRRARKAEHHRRHRALRVTAWVLGVVVVIAAVLGGVADARLSDPPARAVITGTVSVAGTVPGAAPTIAWPAVGQGAVSVPAFGIADASPGQHTVPIASLTKLMTAYLVLRAHPLALGSDGPSVTITPTDVEYWDQDLDLDEANIEVQVGEVLTERQLLEGLLVHSADNLALSLADWVAGSVPAFVAEMNAEAARLGMTQTHYADPSGYEAGSASTPQDQLIIAARDMAIPTFAQIAATTSVTLPIVGTVTTYTPLLGSDLVIGVKSGFTTAAGGCDILAAVRVVGSTTVDGHVVGGRTVLVLAAVTGQTTGDVLEEAGVQALAQATATVNGMVPVSVGGDGERVATARVHGHSVPVVVTGTRRLVGWPGQVVHGHLVVTHRPRAGAPSGTRVGTMVYSLGRTTVRVPVRLGVSLPSLGTLQRLV